MIIKTSSYPRAALIGNPSDGYYGKTIAFTFSNFQADITLYPSQELRILPGRRDVSLYGSISQLNNDVNQFGYYGGVRLIKAAIRKFYLWSQKEKLFLHDRNFTIRYHSNIPLHLGMAGSSAIITAVIRALLQFYSLDLEPAFLANLVLSVETEELHLGAGLQDRVAQAYQGLIYMDFSRELMEKRGYGDYESIEIDKNLLFFIAFKQDNSEGSEVVHNDLRFRYDEGDKNVHRAMETFGRITQDFREALIKADYKSIHDLMNENFNLRESIMNISSSNKEMVTLARGEGASAKFTGSGGAIIGCCQDEDMLKRVRNTLEKRGISLIIPCII